MLFKMSKSGCISRHWTLILNFMPNHHTVQEIFCNSTNSIQQVSEYLVSQNLMVAKTNVLNTQNIAEVKFLFLYIVFITKNIKLWIWQCILQINAPWTTRIATLGQLLYKVYYKNKLYGKHQTKSSMCLRLCK